MLLLLLLIVASNKDYSYPINYDEFDGADVDMLFKTITVTSDAARTVSSQPFPGIACQRSTILLQIRTTKNSSLILLFLGTYLEWTAVP